MPIAYEYFAVVCFPINEGDLAKVDKPRRLQGDAANLIKEYDLRAFVHAAGGRYASVTLTGSKGKLTEFISTKLPKQQKHVKILTRKVEYEPA